MLRINVPKSKELITSHEFMLTHVRYFINILVHNKLKKIKLDINLHFFQLIMNQNVYQISYMCQHKLV